MRRHISGFDYLRAFFSILVIVWHAQAISFLKGISYYLQNLVNIFYYNICLLAVPVFLLISLYLFYKNQLIYQTSFPKKKMMNLIRLYGIWTVIGIAFNSFPNRWNYLSGLLDITNLLWIIIVGSRPGLFFLFSLILTSCFCFFNSKYLLVQKYSFQLQIILLLVSLLVLIFLSFYTLVTHKDEFSAYWYPLCFIPYIFSASILALIDKNIESDLTKKVHKNRFLFVFVLFSSFILFSWLEWQIFNDPDIFDGYLLPPYARVSFCRGDKRD